MTDWLADLRRLNDDMAFARIIRDESRRTVFANPDDADRVAAVLAAAGLTDVVKLVPSALTPVGQVWLADEQAAEASMRESMQRWRYRPP